MTDTTEDQSGFIVYDSATCLAYDHHGVEIIITAEHANRFGRIVVNLYSNEHDLFGLTVEGARELAGILARMADNAPPLLPETVRP